MKIVRTAPTDPVSERDGSIRRVCVLTSRVDVGAFAVIARGLADGLAELGIQTDVLYVEGEPTDELPTSATQHLLGGRSATSFVSVARHLRRTRPDVMISLGWLLNTPAVIAARLAGSDTLVLLNEQSVMSYKARVEHRDSVRLRNVPRVARRLYPLADGLGAVSQPVIDDLRGTVGVSKRLPMVVVPNPVDTERVRTLAGAPSPRDDAVTRFVTVGRLARQKNQALLLEAFALLRRRGMPAELTVVGSGPLEAMLHRKAEELDIAVRFIPFVDNPFPEMRRADVFVLPSEEEGFGLVLVEAMALGVPVVATDCPGGVREVLDGGNAGDLVPPGDATALADAMHRAAVDPAHRASLRQRGLERAEQFNPERVAAQWCELAARVRGSAR